MRLGDRKPTAIVVYGVWGKRGSSWGDSIVLEHLFEGEADAYSYARRCNDGGHRTGDEWWVREHALHLASDQEEPR